MSRRYCGDIAKELRSRGDALSVEATEELTRLEHQVERLIEALNYVRGGRRYYLAKPDEGWKESFTDEEKQKLRPAAEVIAMLDGNAFFGCDACDGKQWYEHYLPEAHAIYESNGGDNGWAGEASFAQAFKPRSEES